MKANMQRIVLAVGVAMTCAGAVWGDEPGGDSDARSEYKKSAELALNFMLAADDDEAKEKRDTPKKKEDSLDELISRALKHSPSILEAEAQVDLASAQLKQAQLQVTELISELYHAREQARRNIQRDEVRLEQIHRLRQTDGVSEIELTEAKYKVATAKQELAQVELRLKNLTRGAPEYSSLLLRDFNEVTTSLTSEAQLNFQALGEAVSVQPGEPLSEQLESLTFQLAGLPGDDQDGADTAKGDDVMGLDLPVTLNVVETPLDDVIRTLSENSETVQFVFDPQHGSESWDFPVTIQLRREVPLRAALVAISDVTGVVFVIRDYGIFVTTGQRAAVDLKGARTVRPR